MKDELLARHVDTERTPAPVYPSDPGPDNIYLPSDLKTTQFEACTKYVLGENKMLVPGIELRIRQADDSYTSIRLRREDIDHLAEWSLAAVQWARVRADIPAGETQPPSDNNSSPHQDSSST